MKAFQHNFINIYLLILYLIFKSSINKYHHIA
ncbi:hypothetical protein F9B32_04770 [Staphylococcus epidermidis]|nr:hypothetical protein F9B32_04770 [Staphylococcus epidermidis]